ncbi:MAG: agmatine deiminase family protein [Pseudomonadota bacterium]
MKKPSPISRRTLIATLTAAGAVGAARGAVNGDTLFAPEESASHARTWMCWPSNPSIYDGPSAYFESVQETIGRLAAAIAENEPVSMLADAALHPLAAQLCGPNVTLIDIPTDDMWARDSAPVFVKNNTGGKALVDFNFNGWGGKQIHTNDTKIAAGIASHIGCRRIQSTLVGEGGGLEYDGDGTLILTESCWVNENRNPGLSRDEIERRLKTDLGVETVIWLPGVRGRDITDGHIDGSLRIVRPGLLMMGVYPGDRTSPWARADAEARKILRKAKDARGRSFDIVDIPSATKPRSKDRNLFTGYSNYYVGNNALYTPEFGDAKADKRAVETLSMLYPDRTVVALNVDRIYESGGGIHCVTQQEPA